MNTQELMQPIQIITEYSININVRATPNINITANTSTYGV